MDCNVVQIEFGEREGEGREDISFLKITSFV